ncbi:MAG TPA: GNAT family N-acetyltransferase [Burkholderiales bacterium]|nr:GNAT family N-acetyltransferase [Burkholderiales bacterium]
MEGNPHGKDQVLVPAERPESFQPIIGQSVILRPLCRGDADIEAAFLTGLSSESRHNRLLGGMIKITREYVEKLTTVDFSRDMALAAALMLEDREILIGVARYVLDPAGRACEFALVIADAWQGRGIGRRMMEKLIAVARGRGLQQIYGDVLSTNLKMLDFCRHLGFTLGRHHDDLTVTRVTLALR